MSEPFDARISDPSALAKAIKEQNERRAIQAIRRTYCDHLAHVYLLYDRQGQAELSEVTLSKQEAISNTYDFVRSTNRLDFRFCPNCGADLATVEQPPKPPAPPA